MLKYKKTNHTTHTKQKTNHTHNLKKQQIPHNYTKYKQRILNNTQIIYKE